MAKRRRKKWIQSAVAEMERKGTKGAFRAWCKARGHKKVTKSCIEEAIRIARRTGDQTLLKRAVFARTLLERSGRRK